MALKTQPTNASVTKFLDAIPDAERRKDAKAVAKIMEAATKSKPVMWGTGIVGFGTFQYTGANGKGGDWFPVGLSPRKQALTVYLMGGFKSHADLLAKLGPHTHSAGGCLYIRHLSDVHLPTLKKLIEASAKYKFSRP